MSAMTQPEDPHDILRALATAKPREGIEARIMARVAEHREETQLQGSKRKAWRTIVSWQRAFAFTAIVIALLAYSLISAWRKYAETNPTIATVPVIPSAPPAVNLPLIVQRAEPRPVAHLAAPHDRARLSPAPVTAPQQDAPLTDQERLLLTLAATQKRSPSRELNPIMTTETINNHGLGENALLELSRQSIQPMPYTSPGETE